MDRSPNVPTDIYRSRKHPDLTITLRPLRTGRLFPPKWSHGYPSPT